jgi:nucleotide-binding universal stress UspA family protein
VIEIGRILCPVDYSDFSRRALDYAIGIARWYGATITVFHVASMMPTLAYAPAGPALPPVWQPIADREQMLAALKRFAAAEAGPVVPLEFDVSEGSPASEILAKAESMSSDLLVLGTHGLSGFDRLLLGSVTEKVLRKAVCPVLTVPSHALEIVPVSPAIFHRILCATDFSTCSQQAMKYALSLAQESDAHLTVLNVLEVPPVAAVDRGESSTGSPRVFREYVEAATAERTRDLARAVPDDARTYCAIDTRLVEGQPYQEILRIAHEEKMDLIVMGVRGRGAADLFFFGSTVQHVLRRASCPVLTLREG